MALTTVRLDFHPNTASRSVNDKIYGQVYTLYYSMAASQGKVIRAKIINLSGNMWYFRELDWTI